MMTSLSTNLIVPFDTPEVYALFSVFKYDKNFLQFLYSLSKSSGVGFPNYLSKEKGNNGLVSSFFVNFHT